MLIKQTKNIFLIVAFIISAFISVLALPETSYAYVCPDGQEFHESDNACWIKQTTSERVAQRGGGSTCPSGYERIGTDCVKFTRTNSQPLNNNGTSPSFSCPEGQTYHSSDNKCWIEETKTPNTTPGRNQERCAGTDWRYNADKNICEKFTETSDKPIIDGKTADDGKDDNSEPGKCEDGSTPDAKTGECADGTKPPVRSSNGGASGENCGEAETVLISCEGEGVQAIGDVLRIIITVLTVSIGVAAVGGLAWASVLYAKAEDNSASVSEARELIRNIVIGILLYGFLVAIINWLVPGGVIGT
jgi:hypothetical protein